jgi:hypothetical protein
MISQRGTITDANTQLTPQDIQDIIAFLTLLRSVRAWR